MTKKMVDTIYFHTDKSEMRDQFAHVCENNDIKPDDKAMENAAYVGYEIAAGGHWTEEGNFIVSSIDGVELSKTIEI